MADYVWNYNYELVELTLTRREIVALSRTLDRILEDDTAEFYGIVRVEDAPELGPARRQLVDVASQIGAADG